jgi:16S rRNA (adenine1518-N6/adenine1519-N6)-dimethyltransferase
MKQAKKQLGQNFLTDKNKIFEIVNSLCITSNEFVFEVGPGYGALTFEIEKLTNNLLLVEIDIDAVNDLKEKLSKKTKLIHDDILNINFNKVTTYPTKFVSNLPYYISSKILFKAIDDRNITFIGVMLQKELIDRINSSPNTKEYGRLSVAINSLFKVEKTINVPRSVFVPQPNVDSGFITMQRKNNELKIKGYLFFVKSAFANKRKTLLNSLKNSGFGHLQIVKE